MAKFRLQLHNDKLATKQACLSNPDHFEIVNNPKYYLSASKFLNRPHK